MNHISEYKAGFVSVVGRPNVGKSTLINAIIGQKIAAVSPRPQTTRKQQLGILTQDNAQIIFTDTPGIHQAKHKLGQFMNDEAVHSLEDSDIILFVTDVSVVPQGEDLIIADILEKVDDRIPIVMVLNKVDLVEEKELLNQIENYNGLLQQVEVISVSASELKNLPELASRIIELLPENPPFYPEDQVTDFYERDIAADLIRETALIILRDEIPHGIAVRIDEFTERGDTGAYIEATLFVERDSQKGIVIGEGGKMIKRISTAAREEIERMSNRKVFLRLRVKVRKNWRNDENTLRLFGFKGK
jgi:GTP-binding protein Era